MELRAFAERVLSGATLADKVGALDHASDRVRGEPIAVPLAPGRPAELAFRPKTRSKRPLPGSLRDDRDRGRILHAFVNHELLALELLALAVLRFPDADPKLRRAWVATAVDEQRHLGLYLDRMATTGVVLGEEGVSTFFWDALAGAPDPLSFTVGLGLVLEQANLDFSRHWQRAFTEAGDPETAAVLGEVYEDEIRHVRIAATHLRCATPPGRSAFDVFRSVLRFPLTPARARGPELDRDGRRRAGLADAFVDELAVTSVSKGRDPRVFLFDPHVEDDLAGRGVADSDVTRDLGSLMMLLAAADDVVVAPRPSTPFLQRLADAGFPIPQFVDKPDPALLPNGRAGALWPWGWSPRVARQLAPLGGAYDPRTALGFDKLWAARNAAAWSADAEVAVDPADNGVICATVEEVDHAIAGREAVIKAALSTGGRHRIVVRRGLEVPGRRWLASTLPHGPVLVEPWLDVVAEWSVQGEVRGDDVRILGITRFGATSGVYRGSVVGSPYLGCDPALQRFLHADGRSEAAAATCTRAARRVGAALAALGHRGPYGTDALVVRGPDGLRLKPVGEVNPRTTMGRLALALKARQAPGSSGFWLFLRAGKLGDTPERFVAAAREANPLRVEGGRVVSGAVATTDPALAKRWITLWWVGPTWAGAVESWERFVPPLLAPATRWIRATAARDPAVRGSLVTGRTGRER